MTLTLRERLCLWPSGLHALARAAGLSPSTLVRWLDRGPSPVRLDPRTVRAWAKVAGVIRAADVHVPGTIVDALPLELAELADVGKLLDLWRRDRRRTKTPDQGD